jgi:hypothetical protein
LWFPWVHRGVKQRFGVQTLQTQRVLARVPFCRKCPRFSTPKLRGLDMLQSQASESIASSFSETAANRAVVVPSSWPFRTFNLQLATCNHSISL